MGLSVVERKASGVYYTNAAVSDVLARWAIRSATDAVLEPCCGDGVFLRAASTRLSDLGGSTRGSTLTAVEIDEQVRARASAEAPEARFFSEDFFDLMPPHLGEFDAVIGNPPFVRYHLFTGQVRERALWLAQTLGVRLSGLTSAWVPFLLHATRFLKPGGRMAVVAPYELTYAIYSRPFVEYLAKHFASVTTLVFEVPLFPELNEKAVLLLCDGYGGRTSKVGFVHAPSVSDIEAGEITAHASVGVNDLVAGASRPRLLETQRDVQDLYSGLRQHEKVVRLGDVASLTIGYVTGDNQFFHLSRDGAAALGLPSSALRVAVRKGSDLKASGLALTAEDARRLAETGENLLFCPSEEETGHPAVAAYIRSGEADGGASNRFKSRARRRWWRVPGVQPPDLFLTVFGHAGPRLVANEARVVATNTILVLQLLPGGPSALTLCAAAQSTLAFLSAEIEGHHLGGGALKFEPSEARRWILPAGVTVPPEAMAEMDEALRKADPARASAIADRVFLVEGLGLSQREVASLQDAVRRLREGRSRRRHRT